MNAPLSRPNDPAPAPAARVCHHCRLPLSPAAEIREEVGGLSYSFCCSGCAGAFQIITGAGLADYYRKRPALATGLPRGAYRVVYDDEYLREYLRPGVGGLELTFLLEGIHCPTCVWLIERILQDQAGVALARVNHGTHRGRVCFDPERISPARIFAIVTALGYLPRPFTVAGAQQAAEREQRSLLIRFGTGVFLSMQLMGFATALYAGYLQGIEAHTRFLMQIFSALATTPVIFYAGWPFLHGAWRSLRNRVANMDLLIALGVLTAYGYSLWAISAGEEVYFDSAAMIVTLLLLGRLLEGMARRRATAGIDCLLRLAPERAQKIVDGATVEVASAQLRVDDLILVRPGDRFPVDGIIEAGETEVDEAIVTGESLPIHRQVEAATRAGSLNISAAVEVRVSRVAADSFVAQVARLVEEAQTRQAPVQALADRVAAFFVPLVMGVALLTAGGWLLAGAGLGPALLRAVAVLVVACPCALGLATPTAVLVATAAAAAQGILFRGGDVLEAMARVRAIGIDKTGTLTVGQPKVSGVYPARGTEEELLVLALAVEGGSNHPLARGIVREGQRRGLHVPAGLAAVEPGLGATLQSAAGLTRAGSRRFLLAHGIRLPESEGGSETEVHLAVGDEYRGCIRLEDPLREEAKSVLAALAALGLPSTMLTGDHGRAAARIGEALGIAWLAELSPGDKVAWVRAEQAAGREVLMVGDGINDAPALAEAAVGGSLAGSADYALASADLVLTRPRLHGLLTALLLGRRALRIIRQNLFWAFFYNLLALPLAASGRLAPIHAAIAMALSSVSVVCNSLRLRSLPGAKPGEGSGRFD